MNWDIGRDPAKCDIILNFKDKIDLLHAVIVIQPTGEIILESLTNNENFGIFKKNEKTN